MAGVLNDFFVFRGTNREHDTRYHTLYQFTIELRKLKETVHLPNMPFYLR